MAENRILSLDGARALSIALVIAAHLELDHYVPGFWRIDTGNLGVRVFFVISGFIITTLLIEELRGTGSINLVAFYRRRIFRIFPAYYTFLGLVLLISASVGGVATWKNAWPAAIFAVDYLNVPLVIGHTWSLAVEEQFYLLWPSALVLLGVRRSYFGCVAILLIAPAFRTLANAGLWPTNPRYAFECVADALAIGCLLGISRDHLWRNPVYRKFLNSPLALLPLLVALALNAAEQNQGSIYYTAGLSLLNVGIAIALDRYMRFPGSIVGRVLNLAPIVWMGFLSYSLYLWQQVFVFTDLHAISKIILIFGCAAISYYAIEKPFQRLRRRIEHHGVATY